ncbi:unnamed protein product [Cuscuta campestris]|uniref:Uncharacterized protein n=1 Tax=Cuscuta campestris TaxID=132261 RepID=A0A484MZS0_9ASTE|nr:unnamed protein product [Cuscuta campestris]
MIRSIHRIFDVMASLGGTNIVTNVVKKAAKVLYYRHQRNSARHSKPPIWTVRFVPQILIKYLPAYSLTVDVLEFWRSFASCILTHLPGF